MEIERKYSILNLPSNLKKYKKYEIEQGYLCVKPTVRIRKSGSEYTLNYKWKNPNITDEKAIHNIEYEMPLTEENYKVLFNKVEGHMIIKTRYEIQLADGHTVELDIFHGNLEGLAFAEIEFISDEDANNFIEPDWLGENITADKRYDNTFLSKIDKYKKEDF